MREGLPTGTVTFLFTDVEGSTRLLHELGPETYAEALSEHRRLIRDACTTQGGVEVDTQGDAFFFAFPTAPGAVAAARTLTEALSAGPIQVRVGLHTGTPLLTDEGYVGDDVHFAARIAASSHGGQVILSAATAKLVELSLTDLGEHRLRDIAQAVPIYQLGDGSFPPLKTISNTNLPRPASSFVGREAEVEAVLSRIEGGARLVTLTGPGGSGKTRLGLEAASSLVPEYKAGVFWVGLASLRDPALVTETIAQTLGAKDGLAEHIGERELLLLLDNLEQVIESAPELAGLLRACPNLTLVVTSRELLRVEGEVEYAVPPLAQPEAVELFCARSQLEPSDEIAELCARLDSLPLAVELAAARTRALTPSQILERLSGRLDLLKGGRDADPRQQTLRATIDWSYELLSAEEQELFARLSVFAGGCTLGAAEEVAKADLDTLQSLVEKSLVRFADERYWMLATVRDFALDQLTISGEAQEVCLQHADAYLDLASRAAPELVGANEARWLDRLDAEHDNFRAALGWLHETDRGPQFLRLAADLWRFWWIRGYLNEGRYWLDTALRSETFGVDDLRAAAAYGAAVLATTQGDNGQAEALLDQAIVIFRRLEDTAGVARCLNTLGNVAADTGDRARAKVLYEESATLFRDLGNELGLSNALGNLGYLALEDGDHAAATRLVQETLSVQRALGNPEGVALALATLAIAAVYRGDTRAARSSAAESIELCLELGYVHVLAFSLDALAGLLTVIGSFESAARMFGAADAARASIGLMEDPATKFVAEYRVTAREGLGPSRFDELAAGGDAAELDEGVKDVLASID